MCTSYTLYLSEMCNSILMLTTYTHIRDCNPPYHSGILLYNYKLPIILYFIEHLKIKSVVDFNRNHEITYNDKPMYIVTKAEYRIMFENNKTVLYLKY